jgi:hypothetical protein
MTDLPFPRLRQRALSASLALLLSAACPAAIAAVDAIVVDFASHADPPLVKKMSIFNSGLVNLAQWQKDIGNFALLKPEAWRMDMSMGKDNCPMFATLAGGPGSTSLAYDWSNADWLKAQFDANGIRPYWGVSYIPYPLQLVNDPRNAGLPWAYVDNENGVFDWAAWRQLGQDFTAHFRAGGNTGYYEVYNEGDLNLQWTDDPATAGGGQPLELPVIFVDGQNTDDQHRMAVMNEMHIQMALGMRAGDPDAVIGGPAYSGAHVFPQSGYIQGFLGSVSAAGAPLDFLSYHSISIDTPRDTGDVRTGVVSSLLAATPQFRATEMHLTEYFSYAPLNISPVGQQGGGLPWTNIAAEGYQNGTALNPYGLRQPGAITDPPQVANPYSSDLAVHFLDDLAHYLAFPEVTQLAWAFGMDPLPFDDPGAPVNSFIGLVATQVADTVQDRKKVYSAFAFYGDLPVQAASLTLAGTINGLAGVGQDKAGVLLWNLDPANAADVTVTMNNIPFANATYSVWVIDGDADGNGHNPQGFTTPISDAAVAISGPQTYAGTMQPRSVLYLRWAAAPLPVQPPATQLVRTHHDYPARGTGTTAFADFDRRTWTAYLGSGSAPVLPVLAQTALTVRGLAPALRVDLLPEGPLPAPGAGATLGLRIDYQTASGYATSVLFHGGLDGSTSCPWGTGRPYDVAVPVSDGQHFTIDVASYAPSGWTGQAVLTAVMAGVPAGVRAAMSLSPGDLAAGGISIGPQGSSLSGADATGIGTGSGLLGSYALGQDFGQPVLTRLDGVVDFDWNTTAPDPALPQTNFCVRWTGQIQAPATGTYTLIARTDDGVNLWFAGQQLISDWVTQAPTDSTAVVTMVAGQRYDLRMDYFQGVGGAEAHLLWAGPGLPRQPVPSSYLYPATAVGLSTDATADGDLVAWYRFANPLDAGEDDSGHGNHALIAVGTQPAAGDAQHPHAVAFTAGSRFDIPVPARDAFTISFWMQTAASGLPGAQWWQGTGLVDADQPGSTSDFGVTLLGGGAAFGTGNPDTTVVSTAQVNDGHWHLVTATRSGGGVISLFVDAVQQASRAGPAGARDAPAAISVGAVESGGPRYLGALDDLRIYRRDLSSTEIVQLAAENLAATTTVNGAGTTTSGGAGAGGASSGASGGGSRCGHGIGTGLILAAALAGLTRLVQRRRSASDAR